MTPIRDEEFDVLVVGGGPAGIASAIEAARGGRRVGLIDENPALGGQIWRADISKPDREQQAFRWITKAHDLGVVFIHGARVFAGNARGELSAEMADSVMRLSYRKLVLAVGARELFLPFPGWTLPGVQGAGGLQSLVKSGLPIHGKTVVVAGSGPLLLAVAMGLREHGATIAAIVEQATPWRLLRFGIRLLGSPSKLAQALRLKLLGLRGIPYYQGDWPIRALGTDRVEGVIISNGHTSRSIDCDHLACGFGLVPNVELPKMLGCHIVGGSVAVNEFQQTGVDTIYCAGESTGIGGVDKSLIEGRIAGLAAIDRFDDARRLFSQRARARSFAVALDRAFALRPELRGMVKADTIVCRCEDVRYGQLEPYDSSRSAKLQTRCGMGPCQGRICGPALKFLRGWPADQGRPPLFPTRIGNLVELDPKQP